MRLETLPIDEVRPYWRNPRRVTDEAVNMVAESIRRFGYQQPIVVDAEHTIIVGHTRYSALRRLGWTEIEVKVLDGLTPAQVRQYRLVDNRTSEYTDWEWDRLAEEVQRIDAQAAQMFFPEMTGTIRPEYEWNSHAVERMYDEATGTEQSPLAEFICPACYHSWETEVTREDVMAGKIAPKKEDQDA